MLTLATVVLYHAIIIGLSFLLGWTVCRAVAVADTTIDGRIRVNLDPGLTPWHGSNPILIAPGVIIDAKQAALSEARAAKASPET